MSTVVIKSKLKFKGSELNSNNKKRKPQDSTVKEKKIKETTETIAPLLNNDPLLHLTKAQQKFELKKREKELQTNKSIITEAHRDRIESFNQKLASMSEHNDIPRISAAGNG